MSLYRVRFPLHLKFTFDSERDDNSEILKARDSTFVSLMVTSSRITAPSDWFNHKHRELGKMFTDWKHTLLNFVALKNSPMNVLLWNSQSLNSVLLNRTESKVTLRKVTFLNRTSLIFHFFSSIWLTNASWNVETPLQSQYDTNVSVGEKEVVLLQNSRSSSASFRIAISLT